MGSYNIVIYQKTKKKKVLLKLNDLIIIVRDLTV